MRDDDKSWLHSDAYDRPDNTGNSLPRTSLLKFGSLGDVIGSIGKLIGQSLIAWFLYAMLFIVLVEAASESDQYFLAAGEIVKLICFTISVFLAVRIFDNADLKTIGLNVNRRALQDFVVGSGIVFIILGVGFVLDLNTGAIRVQSVAWQATPLSNVLGNVLAVFLIFVFVGWSEELLSRGFHLRVLSKGLNRPLGIVLSSVIFSYLHHNNPGITANTYIFIFLTGLVMSAAFLRSGNLWLPMGLHAGWDFFVAVFWGVPISGLRIFHLMDIRVVPGVALAVLPREILELSIIAAVVFFYTRHRKSEITDW